MFLLPRFLVDFEIAAINSVQAAFPDCHISGCFYHLCRCVTRHVASLGLKKEYESNKDFNLQVKSLMSLSFVPPHEVLPVFDQLSAKFPDTEAGDRLLSYFKETFIQDTARNGRIKDPLFKIELWNHYENGLKCVPKTTNCTGTKLLNNLTSFGSIKLQFNTTEKVNLRMQF